jgi:hypothetical protein
VVWNQGDRYGFEFGPLQKWRALWARSGLRLDESTGGGSSVGSFPADTFSPVLTNVGLQDREERKGIVRVLWEVSVSRTLQFHGGWMYPRG